MGFENQLQGPDRGRLLEDKKFIQKLQITIKDEEELLMKARQDINKGFELVKEMTIKLKSEIPDDPQIDQYTQRLMQNTATYQQRLTVQARDLARRDEARARDRARNFIGSANSEKKDAKLIRKGGSYLSQRFSQLEAAADTFFRDEIHGEAFNNLISLLNILPKELFEEGNLLVDIEFHLKAFVKELSENATGIASKTLADIQRDLKRNEQKDFKEVKRAA